MTRLLQYLNAGVRLDLAVTWQSRLDVFRRCHRLGVLCCCRHYFWRREGNEKKKKKAESRKRSSSLFFQVRLSSNTKRSSRELLHIAAFTLSIHVLDRQAFLSLDPPHSVANCFCYLTCRFHAPHYTPVSGQEGEGEVVYEGEGVQTLAHSASKWGDTMRRRFSLPCGHL